MNRLIQLVLLILVAGIMPVTGELGAQSNSIQEYVLPSRYSTNATDSSAIYLDSAKAFTSIAPLRAVDLINKAIAFSIETGNEAGEAKSLLALGSLQQKLGHHDLSISHFRKVVQLAARSSEYADRKKFRSSSIPNIDHFDAYLLMAQSQLTLRLLKDADQSISHCTDQSIPVEAARIQKAMRTSSRIQYRLGKGKQAFSLLDEVLRDERKAGNSQGEIETLLILGELNQDDGNDKKATQFFTQAKDLADRFQFTALSIQANTALAGVYRSQGNVPLEVQARNSNIELNQTTNDAKAIQKEKIEIGNAYLADDKNLSMAEDYLQSLKWQTDEAKEENEKGNSSREKPTDRIQPVSAELQLSADAYRRLAEGFLRKNDLQKSLEYYKRYSVLQDSVKNVQARELEEAIQLSASIGKNQQRISLLEKERELSDQSLEILQRDQVLKNEQLFNRNLIIGVLALFIVLLAITGIVVLRNILARRKADKLLTLQSLGGQMNPHFIFNSLNSVNEYISQNDERKANRYLSDFSKLMRQVMDDSKHTMIPLNEEIDMLRLYLQLEHTRFSEKFDYTLTVDENLDPTDCTIPPMIVQPYLENAIWHGLRYKDTKGQLKVHFSQSGNQVIVGVEDNGIGIAKSRELKTQNQKKQSSMGMKNIETRIQLLNEVYKAAISIQVIEAFPDSQNPGTAVRVVVPQDSGIKSQ